VNDKIALDPIDKEKPNVKVLFYKQIELNLLFRNKIVLSMNF